MKSQTGIVRLKMFQIRERRRHLNQLETMAAEFERMAAELENQIFAEEKKAGITDRSHFAYPTFALAARQRRENLLESVRNLHIQKEEARQTLEQAQTELEHAQTLEQRGGQPAADSAPLTFVQRRAMIG